MREAINLSQIRNVAARRSTAPMVRILCQTKLTPNMLTLLGFAWSLGAAAAIALGQLFLGGWLLLLSGAFDLLDGALARAKGQSTSFGALLDSVIDRLSEAAVFFGLLVFYVGQQATLEPLLVFVALVGSILVSYIRARAEGLGIRCEVGVFTRAERVVVLALGLLLNQIFDALFISLCILVVLTAITVAQRFNYIRQQTKKEDKEL